MTVSNGRPQRPPLPQELLRGLVVSDEVHREGAAGNGVDDAAVELAALEQREDGHADEDHGKVQANKSALELAGCPLATKANDQVSTP